MSDIIKFTKPKRHVPEDGRCLTLHERFEPNKCRHEGPYEVDETLLEVECGQCRERLSPMWVLVRLATKESQYTRIREACTEEQKRLAERSRTKCHHCGEMTRISRS